MTDLNDLLGVTHTESAKELEFEDVERTKEFEIAKARLSATPEIDEIKYYADLRAAAEEHLRVAALLYHAHPSVRLHDNTQRLIEIARKEYDEGEIR